MPLERLNKLKIFILGMEVRSEGRGYIYLNRGSSVAGASSVLELSSSSATAPAGSASPSDTIGFVATSVKDEEEEEEEDRRMDLWNDFGEGVERWRWERKNWEGAREKEAAIAGPRKERERERIE